MKAPKGEYRCSFCGKSQEQVQRLIAGPGGVYICNECITLCREIIEEEVAGRPAAETAREPVAEPARAPEPSAAMQGFFAPLVAELAEARATIERLAGENGALRECVRTLEAEHR